MDNSSCVCYVFIKPPIPKSLALIWSCLLLLKPPVLWEGFLLDLGTRLWGFMLIHSKVFSEATRVLPQQTEQTMSSWSLFFALKGTLQLLQPTKTNQDNCAFPTLWQQFGEDSDMAVRVKCPQTLGQVLQRLIDTPRSLLVHHISAP